MSDRYRVVLIDNPLVSPFRCEQWHSLEAATAFCISLSAGQWRGKIKPELIERDATTEVAVDVQHGKP